MVLRGEHDFVGEECIEAWHDVLQDLRRVVTLDGCAHHGLIEQPEIYRSTISEFIQENE